MQNNRLQEIRWGRDLTTKQLSQKSGISQSEITKIENGQINSHKITLFTAYRLAVALDVDILDIFIKINEW